MGTRPFDFVGYALGTFGEELGFYNIFGPMPSFPKIMLMRPPKLKLCHCRVQKSAIVDLAICAVLYTILV